MASQVSVESCRKRRVRNAVGFKSKRMAIVGGWWKFGRCTYCQIMHSGKVCHARTHTLTHSSAPYALIIHIPISAASHLEKNEYVILFSNIIIRRQRMRGKNSIRLYDFFLKKVVWSKFTLAVHLPIWSQSYDRELQRQRCKNLQRC
jgi:hypothetical protein